MSIRVFILSDNRLFRESLARIFLKKTDIEVIASSQLCPGVLENVHRSGANVLLLDSPDYLRAESAKLPLLGASGEDVKILVVAMEEDPSAFLDAVRLGVSGFVPKEASAMDVVSAVRSVAQGEAICPPSLCKYLFEFVMQNKPEPARRARKVKAGLSRRERQLIPLIDRGLTNKEIASHLHLSEKTVKNHVHRMLHKVGAENRMSLSAIYRAAGVEEHIGPELPLDLS